MTDQPTMESLTETPEPPHGTPTKEAKTMAMLTHLLALCGFVGIPFGNVLGPLILWLVKKDEHPFIDDQGKESLNFQITATIIGVVLGIASLIPLVFCITLPLLVALLIAVLVFVIIAAIKANEGVPYRYPFTLRLIK